MTATVPHATSLPSTSLPAIQHALPARILQPGGEPGLLPALPAWPVHKYHGCACTCPHERQPAATCMPTCNSSGSIALLLPQTIPGIPAGALSCLVAPGGYVTGLTATANGQTGRAATGAYRLDPCPARHFRPSTYTNNSCSLCAPGRETRKELAATVCLACLAGHTLRSPTDIFCSACSPGGGWWDAGRSVGFWREGSSMLTCTHTTSRLNAQPAYTCPLPAWMAAGTYQSSPNTSGECLPCPPGRAANFTAASTCPECERA